MKLSRSSLDRRHQVQLAQQVADTAPTAQDTPIAPRVSFILLGKIHRRLRPILKRQREFPARRMDDCHDVSISQNVRHFHRRLSSQNMTVVITETCRST
jgi:hypothetical protein